MMNWWDANVASKTDTPKSATEPTKRVHIIKTTDASGKPVVAADIPKYGDGNGRLASHN